MIDLVECHGEDKFHCLEIHDISLTFVVFSKKYLGHYATFFIYCRYATQSGNYFGVNSFICIDASLGFFENNQGNIN